MFVPSGLLAKDSVNLARLVLDIRSPEQDYFEEQNTTRPEDIVVNQQNDISQILERTHGSKFHGFLSSILSASFSKTSETRVHIDSVSRTTYSIKNSSDVFERMCELESTKRWLEKAICRGRTVYMVSGLVTILDAEVREWVIKGRSTSLDASVPVATAIAAAGFPLPVGDVLDSGGGRSWQKGSRAVTTYFAPGERILAVQYRKVKFDWFFRRKLEEAELDRKNVWHVGYWNRSAHEDEDEEDVVKAAIVDSESWVYPVTPECEMLEFNEERLLFVP